MISVSQNDGNDTYCQCPECRKVNEYEGSPAGCYVRFSPLSVAVTTI